jgi:hypothetical protein
MRPGHLNGFTLGSILRNNTRLFGDIPPVAKDECETKPGTTIAILAENKRREKVLRERFTNCRKKLEATNWKSGNYSISQERAKEALDLLETAEKVYRDHFKAFEGAKETSGHFCIFYHANLYEIVLPHLFQAEMKAGIIPPVAADDCAKRKDPRLSTHQGGEQDIRKRFIAARKKLHSVDWDKAGMVAKEHAIEAVKVLEREEEFYWHHWRAHAGFKPAGPVCIYAIMYRTLQPRIVKAEEAIDEAVEKAAQTTQLRQTTSSDESTRQTTLAAKLQAARQGLDPRLGPGVQRQQGGFFAWISSIFGI